MRAIPREVWLLLAIGLLVGAIHAQNADSGLWHESDFLSRDNLPNLAKQIAMLGIFALGSGIIIIAGGIDLSTGSVICFTGVIAAKLPEWVSGSLAAWRSSGRCPMWIGDLLERMGLVSAAEPLSTAMLVGVYTIPLLVGLVIGLFHGFLINRLDLPPFVATLGTMAGLRSLASVITTGTIGMPDRRFRAIGDNWYVPFCIFILLCVALGVLLRWTRTGRYLYALGGNEEAARLSGLNVRGLKRLAYVLGGMTAALAGLVHLAHVGGASSQAAVGYELSAIAAAVIGGCNLKGGAGSILGIVLGVVLLRVVINGTLFVIETQATEWEGFIVGVIVILAALLGRIGRR